MDNHEKLLHHTRRSIAWVPVIIVGILLILASIYLNLHLIKPNRVCVPFMKEISWSYTSPTWVDATIYCCGVFAYFYCRLIVRRYWMRLKRLSGIAAVIIILMAGICTIAGELPAGEAYIRESLKGTLFADLLLPQYNGVVFSIFLATICAVGSATFFSLVRLIPLEMSFVCILIGATSGVVAFVELLMHADLVSAICYGLPLFILGILANALAISAIGLPSTLLQKVISHVTPKEDKLNRAYSKRIHG